MYRSLILSFVAFAFIAFTACKPDGNETSAAPQVSHMEDMVVSSSFNWSASKKGTVNLTFSNPENISLDREMLYLINEEGQILEKLAVSGQSATFSVELPANANHRISFPYTGQIWSIDGPGTYNFEIEKDGSNKLGKTNVQQSCTVCNSPIENNLAELPVIQARSYQIMSENLVPGWETTAPDGKIEIWSSGFNGVPAQEGNQFFEINANNYPNAALYQTLCLEPGSTIRWSVYHRARQGVDVARVSIGASVATAQEQGIMSDGTNAWGYYSGVYQVPASQTNTVFVFEAISTGSGNNSVGNFLDNFRIECDQDGDNVSDTEDDFPTDPNRAFKSYFPSSGTQVLAFEDLWPAKGDYDFNDLVLAQKVEIFRNGDDELVEAHFDIAIDAIGAGLDNGIALLLRKSDGSFFNQELVQSFTGHLSNDPDNSNGFIVSDDIFDDISAYYQNNGVGPNKVADTLSFVLSFNAGLNLDFVPELYLFRTSDRSLEVHRPGFSGSAAFDATRFNTLDDNGDFRTANGLPWAIEIVSATTYQHPKERIDMVAAFPQFQTWANSGGGQNQNWFEFPNSEKIFDLSN